MISFPAGSRIWLVAGITDMRNGFNGLASKVQNVLKDDPLKCILCGSQMRFTGLKRGYRLAELVMMHEPLARMQCCG